MWTLFNMIFTFSYSIHSLTEEATDAASFSPTGLQIPLMEFPKESRILLLSPLSSSVSSLLSLLCNEFLGSFQSLCRPHSTQIDRAGSPTGSHSRPPQASLQLPLNTFFPLTKSLLPGWDGACLVSPPQLSPGPLPLSPAAPCMIPKVARGPPRPAQCHGVRCW